MSEESNDALDGEINIDNADNQVWLMKVPKFLADHWAGSQGSIGKIRIKSGDNISLTIQVPGTTTTEEFQLITTPQNIENQPLKIFSEDAEGALALEGNIGLKCDIKMNLDSPTYRELMKTRTTAYNTKTRVAKTIDDNQPFLPPRPINPKIQVSTAVYAKKKPTTDKKERKSEDQVIDSIFDAFHDNNHLDIKTLVKYTDQPQTWLKTVLNKVCIFNKRGPNKNTYELKPEYKNKDEKK
ncbi:hypothetical protein CYY_000999 [Polysphondylium violaceum]|uniref:Transcription initiation factor IIF subunit beta n=1 Tax=Polysphondylium violaceum TaxID=133409 RepID=A0A8J4V524_9MYCE|nr:hypothetical protein CYY_000999 [Polysphondylium violaceum]